MSNPKWVETSVWAVVILNISVLVFVFFIPRAQFIFKHWEWKDEALMETSGAVDTPNQYAKTYKVVNQIRALSTEGSIIFMPPDNWEFGSNRSIVIQRLYPRKVYFLGDQGFDKKLSQAFRLKEAYVVFNEQWGKGLCKNRPVKILGEKRLGICRIGEN